VVVVRLLKGTSSKKIHAEGKKKASYLGHSSLFERWGGETGVPKD